MNSEIDISEPTIITSEQKMTRPIKFSTSSKPLNFQSVQILNLSSLALCRQLKAVFLYPHSYSIFSSEKKKKKEKETRHWSVVPYGVASMKFCLKSLLKTIPH